MIASPPRWPASWSSRIRLGLGLCAWLLVGCTDADTLWTDWDGGHGDAFLTRGDTLPGLLSLSLSPKNPTLTQGLGETRTQAFKVMGTFVTGQKDVTAQVTFYLDDEDLGVFDGGTFSSTKNRGGKTRLVASIGHRSDSTTLTVKVKARVLGTGTPAASESLFAGACTGTGPLIVYPEPGVFLPPNLDDFTVMWTDPTSDLWELTVASETLDLKLYAIQKSHKLDGTTYPLVANSNLEQPVTLSLRGLKQAKSGSCAAAPSQSIIFGNSPVKGGLYYWSASPDSAIIRYDFSQSGSLPQKAIEYYGKRTAGDCVGCHTISGDGSRLAFTFTGGDGEAGILDIKNKSLTTPKSAYNANFQVFTPDNTYIISSYAGALTLRDGAKGTLVATLDTGGKATHPELSPDGKTLVWVRPQTFVVDWDFRGGSIVTAPLQGQKLGSARVLVQGQAPQNNYYPAFSPDGKWIIFNRSASDSYGDDEAQLFIVSASGGTPIELKKANQGTNRRNSWARWSPFSQFYKGKQLFWFSFSSTRDYGTTIVGSTLPLTQRLPQIWMAAIDSALLAEGKDPSFPAFYLTFQEISNNHIAQWTRTVVGIK